MTSRRPKDSLLVEILSYAVLITILCIPFAVIIGLMIWFSHAECNTFAIINPYGEHFPSEGPGQWGDMLDAIGDFVRHGGLWFETGGASFYGALHRETDGTMSRESIGPPGAARLGIDMADLALR